MSIINISWMEIALDAAKQAYEKNEVPVGCIIVKDRQIIAKTHNLMKTSKNQTNHAEKLAIDVACKGLMTGYLDDCDMYVTIEPCHMCATAISFVRVRRLYIGALDEKSGGIYHNSRLYYGTGLHYVPDHYNGFSENKAKKLMIDFFKLKRSGA